METPVSDDEPCYLCRFSTGDSIWLTAAFLLAGAEHNHHQIRTAQAGRDPRQLSGPTLTGKGEPRGDYLALRPSA